MTAMFDFTFSLLPNQCISQSLSPHFTHCSIRSDPLSSVFASARLMRRLERLSNTISSFPLNQLASCIFHQILDSSCRALQSRSKRQDLLFLTWIQKRKFPKRFLSNSKMFAVRNPNLCFLAIEKFLKNKVVQLSELLLFIIPQFNISVLNTVYGYIECVYAGKRQYRMRSVFPFVFEFAKKKSKRGRARQIF